MKTRRAAAKAREEAAKQNDERDEQGTRAGPSTLTGDKGKRRALADDGNEGDALKDSRAKKRRLFHEDIGVYASGFPQNISRTQSTTSAHEDAPLKPTAKSKPTSVSVPFLARSIVLTRTIVGPSQMHTLLREHVLQRNGTTTRFKQRI